MAKRPVVDRDTITHWIKADNRGGVAALRDEPGRPPRGEWDLTIFEALAQEIDKGERSWSVPRMVAWIREGYGKTIPGSPVKAYRVLVRTDMAGMAKRALRLLRRDGIERRPERLVQDVGGLGQPARDLGQRDRLRRV